MLRRFDL